MAEKEICLPASGKASSYGDRFEKKPTASGDVYLHTKFTAAIMPRARWNCVPMGTRVRLTYRGRMIVVKINDKGSGDGSMDRVLDLSRIAMGSLVGRTLKTETDALSVGIIDLEKIEIVSGDTPLGIDTGDD